MSDLAKFSFNEHIGALGFDLDHTLVRYKVHATMELIHDCVKETLVKMSKDDGTTDLEKRYPRSLLDDKIDHDFNLKGLVLDGLLGNFLWLREDKTVVSAVHGVDSLTREQIEEAYPRALTEVQGQRHPRYFVFLSYFEGAVPCLLRKVIAHEDARAKLENRPADYSFLTADLGAAFDANFGGFDAPGRYFREFRAHPEKYLYKRPEVTQWLRSLKEQGKALFVVTNSRYEYFRLLMDYCFDDNWRDIFDIIVTHGKKPRFFNDTTVPFLRVDESAHTETEEQVSQLVRGSIVAEGNWRSVNEFLRTLATDGASDRVIYFGDHLDSDVKAVRAHTDWLAACVLEEVDATHHDELERDALFENVEAEQQRQRRVQQVVHDSPYRNLHVSQQWGAFFHTQCGHMSTWASHVCEHSHLAIPCLSVLAKAPLDHVFVASGAEPTACFYPQPIHLRAKHL
ncbi:MAG: hypothetical protein MHM6MM_002237 [Cercozoa sp. M6MM]